MPGSEAADGRPPTPTSTSSGPSGFLELVIAYSEQELLGPVQQQVKDLGTGIAGSVLMATGTVLLALGFVRALQVELGGAGRVPASEVYGSVGALSGNLSWVPYILAAVFCLLVALFCVWRITQGNQR